MYGVKFGDLHSYTDFGLIMTGCEIGSPEPKTNFVSVPGSDHTIDLSEIFGGVSYERRVIKFTFVAHEQAADQLSLRSRLLNAFLGKKFRIILDADPEFFYIGRFTAESLTVNQFHGLVTFECSCDPYKYEVTKEGKGGSEIFGGIVDGSYDVILNGLPESAYLAFESDAAMTASYNGTEITISAGDTITEVEIGAGERVLTITGNGNIIVYARGYSL